MTNFSWHQRPFEWQKSLKMWLRIFGPKSPSHAKYFLKKFHIWQCYNIILIFFQYIILYYHIILIFFQYVIIYYHIILNFLSISFPVPGYSRKWEPGIPVPEVWIGMDFFIPFPFLNFGNWFFHCLPIPEFLFPFPSWPRNSGMNGIIHFCSRFKLPKVFPAHPC